MTESSIKQQKLHWRRGGACHRQMNRSGSSKSGQVDLITTVALLALYGDSALRQDNWRSAFRAASILGTRELRAEAVCRNGCSRSE